MICATASSISMYRYWIPVCSKSAFAFATSSAKMSRNTAVILLGDRVLRAEPDVRLFGKGVLDAGLREAADGPLRVMHPHDHARAFEVVDRTVRGRSAAGRREHDLRLARAVHDQLAVLVDIAVGVACR